MLTLIRATDNRNAIAQANQKIAAMLSFLEKHLDNGLYITGNQISLAEIVAGSLIIWLPHLNISLSKYSKVELWSSHLMQRPAWQATQPEPEIIRDWLKRIQKLPKVRERQWKQKRN